MPIALPDCITDERSEWLTKQEQSRVLRLEKRAAHHEHGQVRQGPVKLPGKSVARESGLSRSITGAAWGRTVTMLTYKTAWYGGTLHKVPAPNTSRLAPRRASTRPAAGRTGPRSSATARTTDGQEDNAAWDILHLYRMGFALVPAAGRAVVRRAKRVKPAAAR